MLARWLVAALLLLAGCAGTSETPREGEVPGEAQGPPDDGLVATDETGLLRGVVVDEAIRPVAGVAVAVTRPDAEAMDATSDDQGRFGFDDLVPGSYIVAAVKAGYYAETVVAAVRAGQSDPPAVQVRLLRDAETVPYVVAVDFDGFIECGIRGGTGGVSLCQVVQGRVNVTNDRSLFKMAVDPGAAWMQGELVFEANQPLADTMGFYFHQLEEDPARTHDMGQYPLNLGPSPVLLTINETGVGTCSTCIEEPLNMTLWDQLWVFVMAGDLSTTRPPETCSPTGSPCLAGTGVVLEQRFQVFVHLFYRTTPPVGWQFSRDGAPPL
ncbi:MAG: carboxypeptidase-like regulatory domain-containing protein [Thermoplasmatota archaeon]